MLMHADVVSQALWNNYTAEMDDLGGFNDSVPMYIASGLLTYLTDEGVQASYCLLPEKQGCSAAGGRRYWQ